MFPSFISYSKEWLVNLWQIARLRFKSSTEKDLEIIALRSQLALYTNQSNDKKRTKPNSTLAFRQLWVILSKVFSNWKEYLNIFKPSTVIGWHEKAFKFYWRKKSKRKGRPKIPKEMIQLIRKVHEENPLLSPEKIHEQLALLGIKNPPAPNTISKYFPNTRKTPSERQVQSWKTFLKNHMDVSWATDFLTVPTIRFEVLYVLLIINHESREIIHFGLTKNPNRFWLRQQFRNATPNEKKPRYLIHDNDPVFKSSVFQDFLKDSKIESKAISYRSPWQNPYAERVNGILRQELLNHVIPFSEKHLNKLLKEYINDYYNTNRTHQGINCETPIKKPQYIPVKAKELKIKATPVLNGLYHSYTRVA